MPGSSLITCCASDASLSSTDFTERFTARSARLPIHSRRSFNSSISCTKWRSMFLLAEASSDVGLRARVRGSGEKLRCGIELHQRAIEQERGEVADARGLLHVVRDDDDRVILLQ